MILMRKFIVSLNDKSVSVKFQVHLNYYRAFGRSLFFSAFFVPCDFIFASCRHSVAFNSVRFSHRNLSNLCVWETNDGPVSFVNS